MRKRWAVRRPGGVGREVAACLSQCSALSLLKQTSSAAGSLFSAQDLLLIKLYLPTSHAESGCQVRYTSTNSSDAKCHDHGK
jgi:hypothetical protein